MTSQGLHGLTAGDFQVVNLTPVVTGLSATSGSTGNTIIINGAELLGRGGQSGGFLRHHGRRHPSPTSVTRKSARSFRAARAP